MLISGKPKRVTTYLGCALGASCCELKHKTSYVKNFNMLHHLVYEKNNGNLTEAFDAYRTIPSLIIDDL